MYAPDEGFHVYDVWSGRCVFCGRVKEPRNDEEVGEQMVRDELGGRA